MSSLHKRDSAGLHPQFIGPPGVGYLMMSVCPYDSWISVSKVNRASCSIGIDCKHQSSTFLCPGSALWFYSHAFIYAFSVDQLLFFEFSMMGLQGQDSGYLLLCLDLVSGYERQNKVIFRFWNWLHSSCHRFSLDWMRLLLVVLVLVWYQCVMVRICMHQPFSFSQRPNSG